MQRIESKVESSDKTLREASEMTKNKKRRPFQKRGNSEKLSFWCERSQCMKNHTGKGEARGTGEKRGLRE